jgi:hypothetical protein
MIKKINGQTLRQAQTLIAIDYRSKNFGYVKLGNLITDMGVAFATLASHLNSLNKSGCIKIPKTNAKNLNFDDKVELTIKGKHLADHFVKSINTDYKKTFTNIFSDLKKFYEPTVQFTLENKTATSSFAKAFERLVNQNPSEPVLTSIAMYTDLDNILNLMRISDNETYKKISTSKLNLEIRNGRLASIAIPTAIRGNTKFSELRKILGDSWSWMGTVQSASKTRYWQEAMSLGLLQVRGDLLTSLKPTTVDTIAWLAQKTHYTFINTIPIAPKSSLVLFRESFTFPSEEDLFNPYNADNPLPWLSFIKENMAETSDYKDVIREGLMIVRDETNIIQDYEGRIVPRTIIRKVNSQPDLQRALSTIIKNSDSDLITGKILLAITAKPSISKFELFSDLKKNASTNNKISFNDLDETISVLVSNGLVHQTTSSLSSKENDKLYSFVHLPFFSEKMTNNKETNSVISSMKPYLLQRVKELFEKPEESQAIYNIFNDLVNKKFIDFSTIASEYGNILERKIIVFAKYLEPFIIVKNDFSGFAINEQNKGLYDIMISSLQYSILTHNESMGMYNQAIADLVEKDKPIADEVSTEAKLLCKEIIKENLRTAF